MHPSDDEMETLVARVPEHGRLTRPTEPPPRGADATLTSAPEMRRLYAQGEIGAALDLATTLGPIAPRVPLRAIPVLLTTLSETQRLGTDPRAAFLLEHLDGVSDVATLVETAAMPDEDTLCLLSALVEIGVLGTILPEGDP